MKTLWFFLGGLAVLCGISLSVNIFLLRREFDPTRQAIERTQPPALWRHSGDQNTALVSKEKETSLVSKEKGTSAEANAATEADRKINSVTTADNRNSAAAAPPLLVCEVYHSQYDDQICVQFATKGSVDFPLAANVRLSPEVKNLELGRSYPNAWDFSGSFQPEQMYELTIRRGVSSSIGEVIQNDMVFNIKIPPLSPKVRFLTSGPYYPSGKGKEQAANWHLPLSITNLNRVYITLYKAYENNLALRQGLGYNWMDHQRKLKTIEKQIDSVKNCEQLLDLDLTDLLGEDGCGIYSVLVRDADMNTYDRVDVILSDLGLTMVVDLPGRRCQVLIRNLSTGAPVAEADVQVVSKKNQPVANGKSDASGMVKMEFLPQFDDEEDFPDIVVVRSGTDATYMLLNSSHQHDLSVFVNDGLPFVEGPEAFVYTERGVCRPGETMTVSLYTRERKEASTVAVTTLCQLTVCDPMGSIFITERIATDSYGFATLPVKIPANARTGKYSVRCGIDDKTIWGQSEFMVASYVPDRIKVRLESEKTSLVPEDILACQVSAMYYFGQAVTRSQCDFRVFTALAQHPPHWGDYQVGDQDRFLPGKTYEKRNIDLNGAGSLVYPGFAALGGQAFSPVSLLAEATVREPGGRGVSERMTVLCHPTPYYLGIRHENSETTRKDTVQLQFRRLAWTAQEEVPVEALPLNLQLFKLSWDFVRKVNKEGESQYTWEEVRTLVPRSLKLELTERDGELLLKNLSDGRYELIAEAKNGLHTRMTFWHWQGEGGCRSLNPNVLSFVTDREQYAPGDTAEVTLFASEAGYLHVAQGERRLEDGFVQTVNKGFFRFRIAIPLTVSTAHYFAGVTLVSPGRSATRSFGLLRLSLDQAVNRLSIELLAPAKAAPNEEIRVEIKLTGADAKPRAGQVQLFAVDEGILALTRYATPDIFAFFHGRHFCHFSFYDMYSALFPDIRISSESRIGGDGVQQGMIKYLSDTKGKAPALWIGPAVMVPASGETALQMQLPDHVGALRIMAVGVSKTCIGSAAQELLMRDLITVLPTAPRAVAPGDEFQLTLTAFNHELPDGTAELEVQLPSTLVAKSETKHTFALPKGASHTIKIPCVAGGTLGSWDLVGTLKLASSSQRCVFPITVRSQVPVVTMTVNMAVPAGESVRVPFAQTDWRGTPTVKLRISASPALGVKDALDWLNDYPYGCLEQTTATAFPFLGLDNMLKAGLLTTNMLPAVRSRAEQAITAILAMMRSDGSFAMWPGSSWQMPEASVFAAHFLFAAEKILDNPLDQEIQLKIKMYLRQQAVNAANPRWQRAYASYVLALTADSFFLQTARNLLLEQKEDMPSFMAAAALIRGGYAAEGSVHLRRVLDREIWRNQEAEATSSFSNDQTCRQSMVLAILMDIMPNHPACFRLATELQNALRTDGSGWGTTHINAWATYGLAAFAAQHGVGKALGSLQAGSSIKKPINTEKIQEFDLESSQEIVLENTGTAPYYVRLLSTGIPQRLEERRDILEIKRQYLTAEGKEVTRVEQGQLLTVKISINAVGKMEDLVLIDLLPGGLEIEDELLATRAYAAPLPDNRTKQNLRAIFIEKRDDRFLFFGDMLGGGSGEISYQVRAVSRGKFVLPPMRIEGMYDPEVQGTFVPTGFLEIY